VSLLGLTGALGLARSALDFLIEGVVLVQMELGKFRLEALDSVVTSCLGLLEALNLILVVLGRGFEVRDSGITFCLEIVDLVLNVLIVFGLLSLELIDFISLISDGRRLGVLMTDKTIDLLRLICTLLL
jgi:hypothetical protein